MARKLPKTRGKCPLCAKIFFIRPDQCLFGRTLLTAAEKESLYEFDWRSRDLHYCGITDEDIRRVTLSANIQKSGPAGALAGLVQTAALRLAVGDQKLLDEVGIDGIFAARDAVRHLARDAAGYGLEMGLALQVCRRLRGTLARTPSAADIALGLYHEAVRRFPEPRDQKSLYFGMAMLVASDGRDCWHLLKESHRAEARAWKQSGIERIEVHPDPECDASVRASQRTYTVEEVLTDPPIPCKECTESPLGDEGQPWCRCCLLPVQGDDCQRPAPRDASTVWSGGDNVPPTDE